MTHRRSVTITDENYNTICKHRGNYLLKSHMDVDFTTTLNDMIKFAEDNGFHYNIPETTNGEGKNQ